MKVLVYRITAVKFWEVDDHFISFGYEDYLTGYYRYEVSNGIVTSCKRAEIEKVKAVTKIVLKHWPKNIEKERVHLIYDGNGILAIPDCDWNRTWKR